jgi:hypothetical protein
MCVHCRLFAATPTSLKSLRNAPCRGSIQSQCHVSHRTHFLTGVTWCSRCGAYASKRPRALRLPCRGMAPTEARRNVLRRLRLGLMPTTAYYLADLAREDGDRGATRADADLPANGPPLHHHDHHRPRPAVLDASDADAGADVYHGKIPGPEPTHRNIGSVICPPANGQPPRASRAETDASQTAASSSDTVAGPRDEMETLPSSDIAALSVPISSCGGGASLDRVTEEGEIDSRLERSSAAAQARSVVTAEISSACRPSESTHWTRRLHNQRASVAAECSICKSLTRTTCKGCACPVCYRCAKARVHCIGGD